MKKAITLAMIIALTITRAAASYTGSANATLGTVTATQASAMFTWSISSTTGISMSNIGDSVSVSAQKYDVTTSQFLGYEYLAPQTDTINLVGITHNFSGLNPGHVSQLMVHFILTQSNNIVWFFDTTITFTTNCIPLLASISPTNPAVCAGGSITLSGSGGTHFQWSTGDTTSSTTISPLVPTVVTLTVWTDNCSPVSTSVTVGINPVFNVSVTVIGTNPSCNSASVVLTATPGAASYSWTPTTYLSATNTMTVSATNVTSSMTYFVTATGSNGCSGTGSATVVVNPTPPVSVSALPSSVCAGQQSVLTASGASTFSWTPFSSLSSSTGSSVTATPTGTTTYTVTGNALSCTATAQVTLTVNPIPVVIVTGPHELCNDGSYVTLDATGADFFTWSPGTGLNTIFGPQVDANPPSSIIYTITGTDVTGCAASTTFNLSVSNPPVITGVYYDAINAEVTFYGINMSGVDSIHVGDTYPKIAGNNTYATFPLWWTMLNVGMSITLFSEPCEVQYTFMGNTVGIEELTIGAKGEVGNNRIYDLSSREVTGSVISDGWYVKNKNLIYIQDGKIIATRKR